MFIKETSNEQGPVGFVHCLTIPILDRAIIINCDFGCSGKKKAKIFENDIFVVKVGASLFSFMLAACSEHASGRSVVRTANHVS